MTLLSEARDQAAHFGLAAAAVAIVAIPQHAVAEGALIGFAIGFAREFTQHGRIPRGHGSWLDLLFWTIGGASAVPLLSALHRSPLFGTLLW